MLGEGAIERLMDAAGAVVGVGPAYQALLAEAQVDAAVRHGIDARTASELVVGTMAGSAALLEARGYDTLAVRREVADEAAPFLVHGVGVAELRRESDDESLADRVCLLSLCALRVEGAVLDRRAEGRREIVGHPRLGAELADEGEAVGVQARGRQPEDAIAGPCQSP